MSALVSLIENNPLMSQLKHTAELIGYKIDIFAGVLTLKQQIDEYVHISVKDSRGEVIETADGSSLSSYEPAYIHLRNGKCKMVEDCYDECLNNVSAMINSLVAGNFLIVGSKRIGKGFFLSDFGLVEVESFYKKKGHYFSVIQLRDNIDVSSFPKIGDSITINGVVCVVSALGYVF